LSGPLTQGTDYDTSWRADTGGGGTVTTYNVDTTTGQRTQAATGTTTYGPGSDLLLTANDAAEQKQKEEDADYADALNVSNIEQARNDIELGEHLDAVNAVDAENNQALHDYNEANNISNINAGIATINNQEAANTALADYAGRLANYEGARNDAQNAFNDYYAANPNAVQYPDDYGRGITSVIPDVAPNVFPVTGGGIDYGGGGNYDYGGDYGEGGGGNYDYGGDYGGGGGGGCPAPWVPILLADGSTREAGVVEPGMQVWTRHEHTNEWGAFPITAVSFDYADCWKIELTNGNDFVGTSNHRVLTDKGWEEIQKLQSGDKLVQPKGFGIVLSSGPAASGAVVKITVHDAHTYVSSGFVSHNIKSVGGGDFSGGDFNMDEFARGGIASLPKSPGQKLLAAHRAGDMATVHRMLRKVRR
jgi:hypothetical protein